MASPRSCRLLPFLLCALLFSVDVACAVAGSSHGDLKTYMVHVRRKEGVDLSDSEQRRRWHASLLSSALSGGGAPAAASSTDEPRLVRSYGLASNGFSARLTDQELRDISKQEWFLHAHPQASYELHTTNTPDFLGLRSSRPDRKGVWDVANMGEGVIIGVIDSGVVPGNPSFDGEGMPPPPPKWNGTCDFANKTFCNNKLIGATSTSLFSRDPTDMQGHGTHTASTAGGAFVKDVRFHGISPGVMSGMAPRAHLAVYKVCDDRPGIAGDCKRVGPAILAATNDGVDVITASIQVGSRPTSILEDDIAVTSFVATRKGVLVICSAGNEGPGPETVTNVAPWILTVAAGTTDRRVVATVKLGNGQEIDGESLFQPFDYEAKMLELVYGGACIRSNHDKRLPSGDLGNLNVTGKIVLCDGHGPMKAPMGGIVRSAGAAGVIIINDPIEGYVTKPNLHALPASQVAYADGLKVKDYMNSTGNPVATIVFKGTVVGAVKSPMVVFFSSRGPNAISPRILKPDITAPGYSILAAWRGLEQNLDSGTSMAAPHVGGIAALIKKAHPDWSPAAIKSAIMTTAYTNGPDGKPIMDSDGSPAGFYAMGAGHVDPGRALDPGLIYDMAPEDYYPYICSFGIDKSGFGWLTETNLDCETMQKVRDEDLNLPSISVSIGGGANSNSSSSSSTTVTRTVTNVGEASSVYRVAVEAPAGVLVTVEPQRLAFTQTNEKKSFRVTFERGSGDRYGTVEGHLKWASMTSGHVVRSPIVVEVQSP